MGSRTEVPAPCAHHVFEAIFPGLLATSKNLWIPLERASVFRLDVLEQDLFLAPSVRQDGVRRDLLRVELFYAEGVNIEEPHGTYYPPAVMPLGRVPEQGV